MVTAGVYLVVRFGALFATAPWALALITVTGAATALFAALIAITQNDIKKVLAYSTISQLGFMFVAVGSGSYFAGVFHLMTHAFFKALLFLGAGSVIHGLGGLQDIRQMGGLARVMPITSRTFLVGCAAIAGVPLLTSGFYSKDEILWYTLSNTHVLGGPSTSALWNWGIWGVLVLTAALTAFYMFRLYFRVFHGEFRGESDVLEHAHESPRTMTIPLLVLAVLSLVGGFVGVPHVLGGPIPTSLTDLHHWLEPVAHAGEGLWTSRFDGYGMAWLSMGAAVLSALGGIAAAWKMYGAPSELPATLRDRLGPFATAVEKRFWIDEAYQFVFGKLLFLKARALYHLVDRVALDGLVVEGAGLGARTLGEALRRFQSGSLQRYAAFSVLSLGVILYLLVR
jgi:NADH-quinone oxidoreductase subunit L